MTLVFKGPQFRGLVSAVIISPRTAKIMSFYDNAKHSNEKHLKAT